MNWIVNKYDMWILNLRNESLRLIIEKDDRQPGKWMASLNQQIFLGDRWISADEAKKEAPDLLKKILQEVIMVMN